jgi:hypothetical protein
MIGLGPPYNWPEAPPGKVWISDATAVFPIIRDSINAKVQDDGKPLYDIKLDEPSMKRFEEAARRFPDFPFPYYILALYKHDHQQSDWKEYAQKALEILDQTTLIQGHHSDHDEAKNTLQELLAKTP